VSLRARILLAFAAGLFLGFGLFGFWVGDRLRDSYAQSVEETMVDVSQLLAALVEEQSRIEPARATEALARLFASYKTRAFSARIFDLKKDTPALDVYVTDARGIVLFSSATPADVGRDFSRWRDVRLTLDGSYGSRSTRRDPADRRTSVFYVGAPIRDSQGRIIGSLSVVKERASIAGIVEGAVRKMLWLGLLVLALTLAMGGLLFQWITLPLGRLEAYVRSVSAGREAPLPRLAGREIASLGHAFEEMRIAVAGKREIERMTQALSHEMKSPLSAIEGAAELLQEPDMDSAPRARFLANIVGESRRARAILERLLQIASLEARPALDHREGVRLDVAAEAARDGLLGVYSARHVRLSLQPGPPAAVTGDPFLIQQCVRNLIENAIEFSPEGAEVRVRIEAAPREIAVVVEDDGPGIPAFARERIFEKFFSLERPHSGRKGSGLGLSFVKEVMARHGGRVTLESPSSEQGGTRATLRFPTSDF
jgi:two-component system, OmpR family, sensor histidine kinase CreC